MDSTVLAVLVGAVAAGAGGLLVPWLIARVPPWEPPPEREPELEPEPEPSAADSEPAPPVAPPEPPEPYADIARLPGLGWRSAVVGAVAGAIIGGAVGWHWAFLLWVPFVPLYVALALIDWRTRLLPTYLIRPVAIGLLALVVVGAVVTEDLGALERSLLAGLLGFVFFFVVFWIYPRGLGFGDVRLAGVLGLALGWSGWGTFLVGLYSGFLLGGLIGGALAVLRVVDRKGYPFGPFMLVGALIGLFWGADVWGSLVSA
jgi:leader peptidase (prepilin peptidase) / N-methyltransferase